jgi:transposase InsO family protein
MSIANPLWGAPRIPPQARHRYRTDERGQVHGQAKGAAIPRLEDIPPQPRGWDRRDGSVRRTDNLISSALRLVDCGAWSTANFMVWRHSASDRRMDRKSDHGSLRLETSSPLSHSRPGWGLYAEVFISRLRSIGIRDRPTSPRSPWQNGYAERLIGSIRRECLDHVVVQRAPPPSPTAVVHELSQRDTDAFIFGERCAYLPRRRSSRAHSLPRPILGGLHHLCVPKIRFGVDAAGGRRKLAS